MARKTFIDHLVEGRMQKRKRAVDKARRYVEGVAKDLAPRHVSFESFAAHMKKMIPRLEFDRGRVVLQDETGPIYLDLKWMYDTHNPEKKEQFKKSWEDYGRARSRGEYTSRDGWTGD